MLKLFISTLISALLLITSGYADQPLELKLDVPTGAYGEPSQIVLKNLLNNRENGDVIAAFNFRYGDKTAENYIAKNSVIVIDSRDYAYLLKNREIPEVIPAFNELYDVEGLAQLLLGKYLANTNFLRDERKAFQLYYDAAKTEIVEAQFLVAQALMLGAGTPKNYFMSYMWANIASANGYTEARALMETLETMLTIQQIHTSQTLATICFESGYTSCDYLDTTANK